MAETDLIKLYSGRILELAADIPHAGRLSSPQASATKRSPTCGSNITVDVVVDDGQITEFAQDVRACALGQAAAAIVGTNAIGLDRRAVEAARDQVQAMLEGGPPPNPPLEEFEVLIPARDFKNRHQSILLSLNATIEAMLEAERAACA